MLSITSVIHLLLLVSAPALATASSPDLTAIFKNPVVARVYARKQYCLKGTDPWENNNVSVARVASSLAALKPTYVNSLMYLTYNTTITQQMIDDFHTIRNAVLLQSPHAKFDIELNLNPQNGSDGYPSGEAAVAQMKQLNAQLPIDGWWFDFLSTAQKSQPTWVAEIAKYAHEQNQTIGGNIFGSTIVPPNVDAVSFDDRQDASNKQFGYGINPQEVQEVVKEAGSKTFVLGHLNSNPQNNEDITESCVYMRNWTAAGRVDYLNYWLSESSKLNFTYMLPLFFPLCPGATSYSPLKDAVAGGNATVYDHIKSVALSR